jgi:hypothetical protein
METKRADIILDGKHHRKTTAGKAISSCDYMKKVVLRER